MKYKIDDCYYTTTSVHETEDGELEFDIWAPFAEELTIEFRSPQDTVFNNNIILPDNWAKEWHIDTPTIDNKSIPVFHFDF